MTVRFNVRCQPDRTAELAAAMKDVVGAARRLPAAMEREEALPEVAKVVELMRSGALAGQPEWTVFEIASSESPTA